LLAKENPREERENNETATPAVRRSTVVSGSKQDREERFD